MQCELARTADDDPRRVELVYAARALLDRHEPAWRAELPKLNGVRWGKFERGFVGTVRVNGQATLVRFADAITAAAPVSRVVFASGLDSQYPMPPIPSLRRVSVTGTGRLPLLESDLESLSSATVEELDLSDVQVYEEGLSTLMALPKVARLRRLYLNGTYAGDRGLQTIIYAGHRLAELERLSLSNDPVDSLSVRYGVTDFGVARFAGSGHFGRLRELVLDGNSVTGAGLRALIAPGALPGLRSLSLARATLAQDSLTPSGAFDGEPRLTRLNLRQNAIGSDGFAALCGSACFADLTVLDVGACEIGPAGVRALSDATFAPKLRVLDLAENPLESDGVLALAAAELPQLHSLKLSGMAGRSGVAALAGAAFAERLRSLDLSHGVMGPWLRPLRWSAWPSLQELWLDGIDLSADAADGLAAIRGLRRLSLADNPRLGDRGVTRLVESGALESVQELDLSNACGPLGVRAVFASSRLPSLTRLAVRGCGLTEAEPRRMVDSPLWPQLAALDLSHNPLYQWGVPAISSATSSRLAELRLAGCHIGDGGFQALAVARDLTALQRLAIGPNADVSIRTLDDLRGRYEEVSYATSEPEA